MPKLTDTQTLLLSTAAQRDDRSLYPLPDTVTAGARVHKAVAALVSASFAEERETTTTAATARIDGDLRYGVFVTAAGFAAIGIEPEPAAPVDAAQAAPEPALQSKTAAVLALLRRDGGATMPDLIAATGWLPHTTRAALTGLRKKGHVIERFKRDEATSYRIIG